MSVFINWEFHFENIKNEILNKIYFFCFINLIILIITYLILTLFVVLKLTNSNIRPIKITYDISTFKFNKKFTYSFKYFIYMEFWIFVRNMLNNSNFIRFILSNKFLKRHFNCFFNNFPYSTRCKLWMVNSINPRKWGFHIFHFHVYSYCSWYLLFLIFFL